MDDSLTIAQPKERCASCFNEVINDDVFCTSCGYPIKGTEQEQRIFLSHIEANNIDYKDYNDKVKRAGNSLYYLAGFSLLGGIISFFLKQDDPNVLAYTLPSIILAVLFLALGSYSRKKPLACIVSGLVLYLIVQILLIIDNPVNIASGIIVKIIIIGYLINGIKSALELEKFKKEHNIKD
ncbi:hypothetical protein IDJ75_06635 [Mucilaginibacter rigui]|uniref:Zinc ribbon domain-containing protein n=1 Tax=Mucilaginibacter rigui TaxID=534635 RepID=A0ABR7X2Z0_9SPHI|nr:hypothetical protein [Mucilaginibacter rigui]MBD1384948.1 hypothetical protein [Mucilaginibacter rigui]